MLNRPADPDSVFSTRNPLISPSFPYTLDGAIGAFKTVDNLSWLRVFASGHQVSYFVSLEAQNSCLKVADHRDRPGFGGAGL